MLYPLSYGGGGMEKMAEKLVAGVDVPVSSGMSS
jgi:Asp/Glu/hydantoin racemase